jgi:membrane fusion protein (multidrug efflux system)
MDKSGSYVLTVGADNKVAQQPITIGRQIEQDDIVTKGLTGGERVIVAGVQKVHPGETVNPTEAPPPAQPNQPGATAANDPASGGG